MKCINLSLIVLFLNIPGLHVTCPAHASHRDEGFNSFLDKFSKVQCPINGYKIYVDIMKEEKLLSI